MPSVNSTDTYYSLFSKHDDKADLNCNQAIHKNWRLKQYKFHLGVWCPEGHVSEGSLSSHLQLSLPQHWLLAHRTCDTSLNGASDPA